jgi:hypothetical protein
MIKFILRKIGYPLYVMLDLNRQKRGQRLMMSHALKIN